MHADTIDKLNQYVETLKRRAEFNRLMASLTLKEDVATRVEFMAIAHVQEVIAQQLTAILSSIH